MRIALDAMGGDNAPEEIVKGAVEAVKVNNYDILLVGKREVLEAELGKHQKTERITIIHAPEVVEMSEAPALALRRKKGTSIGIASELVKKGEADALVSAGSTGAQLAAALLIIGRIKGIQRPGIITLFPGLNKPTVLLDVGANTDVSPENLFQFAVMGGIYAEKILARQNPTIGLLNNGTEENKGNDLTKASYKLFRESNLNFIGNIEARDLPKGVADVLVCDGFVGNMILKMAEGLGNTIFQLLKKEVESSFKAKIGGLLLKPGLKNIKAMMDYTEYGGAPLLGVKGISIICHGSSNAYAIANAIKMAALCVEQEVVGQIEKWIQVNDSRGESN
ncbi:MAG: phosphate acyltransferase PlsX [Bacillota bacterium]